RIKTVGDHIIQMLVLEYRKIYSQGMTINDFIGKVYDGIDEQKRTKVGIDLFEKVFLYLSGLYTES
ncbi:hypothetical protein LJC25_05425, partial [Bacteroidales bacterium OttesenSCG-928-K03]|nr:hypothetical protein [Bacteroidales bacterium OttesenSCG-928-K03]